MKPPPKRRGFWRWCRICFRAVRILCLLGVLALLSVFLWCSQVRVPEFIKGPLIEELRGRGLTLEIGRLRWVWFRGFVAESISVARAGEVGGPKFRAAEAVVRLDHDALRRFELLVSGILLGQGEMAWLLGGSNQPPREFLVQNLSAELRFLPGDVWELAPLNAEVQGIRLRASATITNASTLRTVWNTRARKPGPEAGTEPADALLKRVLDALAEVRFTGTPELEVTLRGDAAPERGWQLEVSGRAPAARTHWGSGRNADFTARISQPPGTNGTASAEIKISASRLRSDGATAAQAQITGKHSRHSIRTNDWDMLWELQLNQATNQWGGVDALHVSGRTAPGTLDPSLWRSSLSLSATRVQSPWADLREARATGTLSVDPSQRQLHAANAEARLTAPRTRWGEAAHARTAIELNWLPGTAATDSNWGFWTNLAPWSIALTTELEGVAAPELSLPKFSTSLRWRAPELTISELHAELAGGALDTNARLDVATRSLTARGGFDFDVFALQHLLGDGGRRELSRFKFSTPPRARVAAAVTLPAWTNRQPDWIGEVLPTLTIASRITAQAGAYRGVPFNEGHSDLTFTNGVLRLPNLWARRPEGEARLDYTTDTRTQQFHWAGRAQLFPHAIEPVLERPEEKRVLTNFVFLVPPAISGEVRGRWRAPEELSIRTKVAMTNFVLRGEPVAELQASVDFTNQSFVIRDLHVRQAEGTFTAPEVRVDLHGQRVWITNGVSSVDPDSFTRAIGPKTAEAIAPYRFARPPAVLVHGSVGLQESDTTDLHFSISGGPFAWSKFKLPEISGEVHWVTNTLAIANLAGSFYGGSIAGGAFFDFAPSGKADFNFLFAYTNATLPALIADVSGRPNQLEGRVHGTLLVTNANTADWQSWQGSGDVRLHDGLLWEIPIFGLFSPVLNAINKDLGRSRAKEAKGTFIITNSVIYTKNLEIHSPPARLHYDGTVDFAGAVNANIGAEMFRDTFLVGPLLSLLTTPVTKVFEYKVTGTLGNPRSEPRFIPKLLLLPLKPFQTIREFLTPKKPSPETP